MTWRVRSVRFSAAPLPHSKLTLQCWEAARQSQPAPPGLRVGIIFVCFSSNLPSPIIQTDIKTEIFLGGDRTYVLGFGYGATWGSIILIFASVVLLICDRESEEIFYKERQIEDEEEEEEA